MSKNQKDSADLLTGPIPHGPGFLRTAVAPTADSTLVNQVWSQSLPGHARLSALVGPSPMHLQFDCADEDFEFALTSSWPLASGISTVSKSNAELRQADLMQLAELLNGLVRLYALETGNTNMHVLVEARRGVVGVPAWWDGHPCLFATYAFDTAFNEVGLFTDPAQAFAAMELIGSPHRLLLAVGPAQPEWLQDDTDETWLDADSRRIEALKRVEAQISRDIARLMANTVDLTQLMADAETGGMYMEEALVQGLSRVRQAVQKMRGAIVGYETKRNTKRVKDLSAEAVPEMPSVAEQRQVKNQAMVTMAARETLADTVRELQGVLKRESTSPKMPLPARSTFRRGLTALTTLEQSLSQKPVLAAVVQKAEPKIEAVRALKAEEEDMELKRPLLQHLAKKTPAPGG